VLLDGVNHIAWVSKDAERLKAFYARAFDADVGPTRAVPEHWVRPRNPAPATRSKSRAAQAAAAVQYALASSTVISVPALRVLPRKKSGRR
jgi:hypothetical protein